MQYEARYFDAKSATPNDVFIEFNDNNLAIFDTSKNLICQYPYFNLSRNTLAEVNDIRFKIAPHGNIVFPFSEQLLDLLQSKIPSLAKAPPPSPEHKKLIKKISYFAWGSLSFVIFIWPLFAPALTSLVSSDLEENISKSMDKIILKDDLFIENENAALGEAIDKRLNIIAHKEKIPHQILVSLLNEDTFNAFALPGGRIVLYCGLVQKVDNKQLSFILSHEMAHIKNRDAMTQYIKMLGINALTAAASGANSNVNSKFLNNMGNLTYNRKLEQNADTTGISILKDNGYNSSGAVPTFETFINEGYGYSFGIDNLFASHPDPRKRISNAQKFVDNNGGDLIQDNEFAQFKKACK